MMRLSNYITLLLKTTMVLFCLSITIVAIDIDYVGTINDNLTAPTSIVLDNESLAVLEPFRKQIKIYSSDGILTQKINIEGNASGLVKIENNKYLFCDWSAGKVKMVDLNSGLLIDYLPPSIRLHSPFDITINGDMIYILDGGSGEVHSYDVTNQQSSTFQIRDSLGQSISFASSFALDIRNKRFYILDQTMSEIWTLNLDGEFVGQFGSYGNNDGQLTRGGSIIHDNDSLLFISDRYQGRVLVFDIAGNFLKNIDLIDYTTGRMIIPTGLAIDNDNLLYVASTESANIDIFRITKSSSTQAYFMELVFPRENDQVSPEELKLSVQVEVIGNPDLVTGIDFELFSSGDTINTIMEIDNNGLSNVSDIENGIIVSEWELSADLAGESEYLWRARVRTDQATQPWTVMRSFKTTRLLPVEYMLYQNYPNPFNPNTKIAYALPEDTRVKISIYNVRGQLVRTLIDIAREAGNHEAVWDGTDESGARVSSGIYFYKLNADNYTKSKKMVMLK